MTSPTLQGRRAIILTIMNNAALKAHTEESENSCYPCCRGVELVSALQQCIRDADCPAAAALGLEALGVLCEEDVLDFYKAWKVVHRCGLDSVRVRMAC